MQREKEKMKRNEAYLLHKITKGEWCNNKGGRFYHLQDETDEKTGGSGSVVAVSQPRPPQ